MLLSLPLDGLARGLPAGFCYELPLPPVCADPPEDPNPKCQQRSNRPDEGPAAVGPQEKTDCCTGRQDKASGWGLKI